MQQNKSRNFLNNPVTYTLGIAALAIGCQTPKTSKQKFDDALANAQNLSSIAYTDTAAGTAKVDTASIARVASSTGKAAEVNLDRLVSAADTYKKLDDSGVKTPQVSAEKARLAAVLQYGLENSESDVYVLVNAVQKVNNQPVYRGISCVTPLKGSDLAELVGALATGTPAKNDAVLLPREVVDLVALAKPSYKGLGRTSTMDEAREAGYFPLENTERVEKLLALQGSKASFRYVDANGQPVEARFTLEDHEALKTGDYVQGAYVKQQPAFIKLVVRESPKGKLTE